MTLNINKLSIIYGGVLLSLLIVEMVAGELLNLYAVRFLQIFIVFNLIWGGVRILSEFYIYIIPAAIFIVYSIFSFDIEIVRGDFFNIVWWTTFMIFLNFSIKDKNDFEKLKSHFVYSTFILTTIFSVIGLIKLFLFTKGIVWERMLIEESNGFVRPILGTSLSKDYNVYSIGVFCGTAAGMSYYQKAKNIKTKILYALLIILSLFSGMMSMSRRGVVIGLFFTIYLLIWSFYLKPKPYECQKGSKFLFNLPWFAIFIGILLLFFLIKSDVRYILSSSDELSGWFSRIQTITSINSEEHDTRGNRWSFAWNFFIDTPFYSKTVGSGFEYLRAFGTRFEEADIDYPHNVWISSLLYGGVVGFLFTCGLTIKVLMCYMRKRHIFGAITYWYLLFILLNFTSSNTVFSSKAFTVLLLFPFLSVLDSSKKI